MRARRGIGAADARQPARVRASCCARRWPATSPTYPLSVAPERVPGDAAPAARRPRALPGAARPRRASPLEPTALELGFGFAGRRTSAARHSELPAFELGDGVRLRGRIDRVDAGGTGQAVVYDYKGRAAPGAARWITEGSLQVALYMRAVEELLGLQRGGRLLPAARRPRPARARRARRGQRRGARVRARRARASTSRCASCSTRRSRWRSPAAGQAARGELEPRPRDVRLRRRLHVPDDLPLRALMEAGCQLRIEGLADVEADDREQQRADALAGVELTDEQEQAVAAPVGAAAAVGRRRQRQDLRARRALRAGPCARTGSRPRRILAITFTERAAGELRERVRARLLELGEREAARDTEAAFVGTFHGFCARLLRAHPLVAGLDPGVRDPRRGPRRAAARARVPGARCASSSTGSAPRRSTCSPPTAPIACGR